MKEMFPEFYPLTSEKIDEIWDKGTIVFDTNALLNLYRYSIETRDDFISALNKCSAQLWMPYQVGYEYMDNKSKSIEDTIDACNQAKKLFKTIKDDIVKTTKDEKNLNNLFSPYQLFNEYIKNIYDSIDAGDESIDKLKNKHEAEYQNGNDPVLDEITKLYDGKVGEDLKEEGLDKLYAEGKTRYKECIPPGFCDYEKAKFGQRKLYGDLILWKQILNYAKEKGKDVLFVTAEKKRDWWKIINDKKIIAPLPQLIKEFRDETGEEISIISPEEFITQFKEHKDIKIKDSSVDEIKTVDRNDLLNSFLESDYYLRLTEPEAYPWATQGSIHLGGLGMASANPCTFVKDNSLLAAQGAYPFVVQRSGVYPENLGVASFNSLQDDYLQSDMGKTAQGAYQLGLQGVGMSPGSLGIASSTPFHCILDKDTPPLTAQETTQSEDDKNP
ncbi:MAG: PIN domain-containing protein [Bacteroidales bacterium]|jgi:hypothetical protein|nr:PIN domain-containing protein [Bacteroidales bacterium]